MFEYIGSQLFSILKKCEQEASSADYFLDFLDLTIESTTQNIHLFLS